MSNHANQWMDQYASPQRLVRIGLGRSLNLHVTGEGSPTVVLAAGFLGTTFDWLLVQPKIASFAQVVSFDDAGLGFSDPGPLPRTSSAIVDDLRAALRAAKLAPPYVLVGHSAGSLRMRLFAARYASEVCGLVMVDPVSGDWQERLYGGPSPGMLAEQHLFQRFLRLARKGLLTADSKEFRERVQLPRAELSPVMNAALLKMWLSNSYLQAAISESQHVRSHGAEEISADGDFGSLPLIVLSAAHIGRSPITAGVPAKIAAWFEMQEQIARLSTRGSRQVIAAGHNIPIEAPAAVVEAVQAVLTELNP